MKRKNSSSVPSDAKPEFYGWYGIWTQALEVLSEEPPRFSHVQASFRITHSQIRAWDDARRSTVSGRL